jgi:hypothetical protein
VISQIYGAGGNTGALYREDYVELFNRGTTAISLSGWSIQYTSATGTGLFSASVTTLSGSIAPEQYYLVQLTSGGANGAPLPTPDATDSEIGMGTANGKVVLADTTTGLACNGSSTPCSATDLAHIVDLVGYGSANFYEGSGAAPAAGTATALFRAGGGCVDTDNNNADFSTGTPAPRNTASPLHSCAAPTNTPTSTPTPTDTSTPTNTPTSTTTPTSTFAPASTPTNTPTSTPTSTSTSTHIPTPTSVSTPTNTPGIQLPATGYRVYLPYAVASSYPDLVIDQISTNGGSLQVVVKNIGSAAVTAAFWVDLYVDPRTPPTGVNQTWNMLGAQGLVWGVSGAALPLAPGTTLTLRAGDAYFRPEYSRQTGTIAPGTPLFAQVDSYNADTTYGAVLESHEADGRVYNNSGHATTAQSLPTGPMPALTAPGSNSDRLPQRPNT